MLKFKDPTGIHCYIDKNYLIHLIYNDRLDLRNSSLICSKQLIDTNNVSFGIKFNIDYTFFISRSAFLYSR